MTKQWVVTYYRKGWPRQLIVEHFNTEDEGAAFLGMLEEKHGDQDVAAGEYGLEGPAEA